MSQNNQKQYRGTTVGDFIPPDQLAKIKEFASEPATLEGKLELYAKRSVDHEVTGKNGHVDRRSQLGTFINKMFKTELPLPSVGRRQQIGKAIKFGKDYLIENPDVSVYFAAAMGAAMEYREWMALVGDLQPEQQLSMLNSE